MNYYSLGWSCFDIALLGSVRLSQTLQIIKREAKTFLRCVRSSKGTQKQLLYFM